MVEVDVHPSGDYNYNHYEMDEQLTLNPDSTPHAKTDGLGAAGQRYGFSFDPLNRLSGWSSGAGLSCGFGVDRFGNLADASGNPSCGMLSGQSFNANNQVAGTEPGST